MFSRREIKTLHSKNQVVTACNLIWCRMTAKYLVQNKKQISAKKAENLHGFNKSCNVHGSVHGACTL